MADFKKYWPTLCRWEGTTFTNIPGDNGGPTKYGVILREWVSKGYDKDGDGDIDVADLKLITADDAIKIAKAHYWDRLRGDDIISQSVAEILIDFAYNCGVGTAAMKTQKILKITADGVFGPQSVKKINAANPAELFEQIKAVRTKYYNDIVKFHPAQVKFLKGWLNRINSFKFVA